MVLFKSFSISFIVFNYTCMYDLISGLKKNKKHSFLHVYFNNDNIVFVTSLVYQKQPVALGKECDIVYVEIAMSRSSSSGPALFA